MFDKKVGTDSTKCGISRCFTANTPDFRHELGFIPPAIDGKRHELRVELTKKAKNRNKRVRLRFRSEYIPVGEGPDRESDAVGTVFQILANGIPEMWLAMILRIDSSHFSEEESLAVEFAERR
jgi:hypothetical protein